MSLHITIPISILLRRKRVAKATVSSGYAILVDGKVLARVEDSFSKEKERDLRGGPVLLLARRVHSLKANSNEDGQGWSFLRCAFFTTVK